MRAAILDCAAGAFSRREFHEVLIDDIAAEIGIGKGTLYRYFASKEDLYFATIVRGLDGMHERLTGVLRQRAPLERTIEGLVETVLEYFWHRRDFFILLYRMEPKLDPDERAEWQQRREEVIALAAAALQRGTTTGTIGRQHPRLAVELLLGMVRSACLYRRPGDTRAGLARAISRAFLHGVSAPRVQGRGATRSARRPLRVSGGGPTRS